MIDRRTAIGWGLAAAAAPTIARVPGMPAGGRTIGFVLEDSRLYAHVTGPRGIAGAFILDTGASGTIIDSEIARSAGLLLLGERSITGPGGGSSRESRTRPIDLSVGGAALHVAQPSVGPLAALLGPTSGRRPAGIIGSQFFREHVVALDFGRKRITLAPPEGWRYRGDGEEFPLEFVDGTPLAKAVLTTEAGRSIAMKVLLDLGAKSTLLIPEPFIAAQSLRQAFPRVRTSLLGAGVGGDTRYAFGRAARIALAGSKRIALDSPVVGLSVAGTLKSTWYDGLLGADFLSRFRVIFDYARARVILEPQGGRAAEFDMSGLFLVADDPARPGYAIREILADSPAARAGLVAGDRLVEIDGMPVVRLGLAGARERLKSGPGRMLRLKVERQGRAVESSIQLALLV